MSISAEVWIGITLGAALLIFAVARLGSLGTRLAVVERRLGRQEEVTRKVDHDLGDLRMTVVGLATKDSVSAIQTQVAELRGDVKTIGAATTDSNRKLDRIENYLMDAAARRVSGIEDRP